MASAFRDLDRGLSKQNRIAIEVKTAQKKPFANDPDLKRTVNRLASTGSQFAGWVSSKHYARA